MKTFFAALDWALYFLLMFSAILTLLCAVMRWPIHPRALGVGLFWAFFTAAKTLRREMREAR